MDKIMSGYWISMFCLLAFGIGSQACSSSNANGAPGTQPGMLGAGAVGMPQSGTPPGTVGTTPKPPAGSMPPAPAVVNSVPTPPASIAGMAGASGAPPAGMGTELGNTPPAVTNEPQITCPDASKARKAGAYDETIMSGGSRTYAMQIPKDYDGSKPVAVVFDYHGLGSTSRTQLGYSGWRQKGDEKGFIVVEPQGVGQAWNGGSCCGSSSADDIQFTKDMVKKISEEFCVNPKRVYATGLSNGGAMSHRLACEGADFIAASAPVSMGGLTTCSPARPITIVEFRGTSDTTVSYNGGSFRSAQADFEAWGMIDGCTGAAADNTPPLDGLDSPMAGCKTYTECKDGVTVTLCSPPTGHVLYNGPGPASKVADIAWPIFEAHPMP